MQHLTLQEFAARVAQGPTPAGVAVAATAAAFSLQLLAMALEVTARHRKFAGDRAEFARLGAAARIEAANLMRYAQEDSAAFEDYLNCLRRPANSASERNARQLAAAGALRKAIEVPLAAARAAIHGLELCAAGAGAIHAAVAADLGGAAELLTGSVRAILLSVAANARRLAHDSEFYHTVVAQRAELENSSARYAQQVRELLKGLLAPPAQPTT